MYRLWFRFAKKRILGTRRDYFYVHGSYSFSGLRTSILIAAWFLGYGFLRFYFVKEPLGGFEVVLFTVVFILVSEGLTYFVGLALQKTVYILELPWYLRERSIFISGHNLGREEVTKYDKHQDGVENFKKAKEDSAFGVVRGFIEHTLKFAVWKLFDKTAKRNGGLSDIRERGKREHVGYKQVKVGEREPEQNSFSGTCKLGRKEKGEKEDKKVDDRSRNGSSQQLDAPGGRGIGFFKYCAPPTIGNGAEGNFGFSNPDGEDWFAPSDDDLAYRYPSKGKSYGVSDFVEEYSNVACNCERTYEHQCYRHLAEQLPVGKLSTEMKLLIVVSSPLWLVHLLFDRGRIEVVTFAEYNKVDDEYSGSVIDGGRVCWEADKDAIVNAVASGFWGVLVGCTVLLQL